MAYKFNNDEEAKQFLDSKKFMVYPGGGVVPRTTTLKNYPRNANHIQESVAILDGGRVFLCHGKDDKSPLECSDEFKNARRKLENMLETEVALGNITKE